MPTLVNVEVFTISVIFEPVAGTVELQSPDFSQAGNLSLPQGIHMVLFEISPLSEAAFPSSPILWLNETGGVASQPPGIMVCWQNAQQVAFVVFNAIPMAMDFLFKIVVTANGQIFASTDPTIICDPPGTTT